MHHFIPHGKICTQLIDLAPNVWLHSSVGGASQRYRGSHGFESRRSPDSFQVSSFRLLKAGVNLKAVFWPVIMALTQISRLRFKQSRNSMLITHIYVLGCFVNFLVIFRYIWR